MPPRLQVGLVLEAEAIEGKDKLTKLTVDVGAAEPLTIVTNAPNAKKGSLIVVALVRTACGPSAREL